VGDGEGKGFTVVEEVPVLHYYDTYGCKEEAHTEGIAVHERVECGVTASGVVDDDQSREAHHQESKDDDSFSLCNIFHDCPPRLRTS